MALRAILTDLLYPPACLLCRADLRSRSDSGSTGGASGQPILCPACVSALPRNGPPVCARCGMSLSGAFDAVLECARCRRRPPAFEMARAPWRYAGSAQAAIRQFKYHRRWRLGRWLSDAMTATARACLPMEEIAVVVPVPRHWLKRRLAGDDPARRLARVVARSLGKPYVPSAIRRTRWTASQTRLRGIRRRRNVQGAFRGSSRSVNRLAVLLIDDVLTSGATAGACAAALKDAGAARVFVLTAARTPLA